MSVVRLFPHRVAGSVVAPPSKSYTHRALVAAHLSGRAYRVVNPLDSDDTRATARGLTALGTPVHRRRGVWTVGPPSSDRVSPLVRIDCGESGTTLRFLTAVAALSDRRVVLRGRGRLPQRPVASLLRALAALGATARVVPPSSAVEVQGPIHSGRVSLDASESSQFASALLFALPTLEGDSVLRLTGPIVSAPYIEATLAVLAHHRVRVHPTRRVYRIPGGQRYRRVTFHVPGDASSAAYLWTAAAVTGGKVRVTGLPNAWPQADGAILSLLHRAGAKVTASPESATVEGPVDRPFSVDLTDTPDLYPLAGVLASVVRGRSLLLGASHVAGKESDRRVGTERVARGLGARVRRVPGGLAVEGTGSPRPLSLRDLSDHRMVMSAAVGALVAEGPSSIGDARAVDKSFPKFWEVLHQLSGGVEGR